METKPPDTAPATAPASPEAFIYFSELPIELRLKIFRHAILPRTVALILTKSNPQLRALKGPQPALLHVNSESRHEALRTYQTLDLDAYFQPHLYFNFDMDTLYFSNGYELEFFLLHAKRYVTRQVKSLNLSAKAIDARRPTFIYSTQLVLDIFFAFQYLENFTLLAPPHGRRSISSLDIVVNHALGVVAKYDPGRKPPYIRQKLRLSWRIDRRTYLVIKCSVDVEACAEYGLHSQVERYGYSSLRVSAAGRLHTKFFVDFVARLLRH